MSGQRVHARFRAEIIVAISACLLSLCLCLTAEVPRERENIALVAMRPLFEPPSVLSKSSRKAEIQKSSGRLPLSFEVNRGQFDNQVDFRARGNGYSVFLTSGAAVFTFQSSEDSGSEVIRMDLVNANPVPKITGLEKLPGKQIISSAATPKNGAPTFPPMPECATRMSILVSTSSTTAISANSNMTSSSRRTSVL